jgi:phage tail tape-measure protein
MRMSTRRIYSAPDLARAEQAVAAARDAGLDDDCLSLVARSDIEVGAVPDEMKQADTDMLPAAARGAGLGAAAGAVAGLAAMTFPPLGLTLAGALLGGGAAGALVGSWASALAGASIQEPERRRYEAEIEAGRVLVVIDADDDRQAHLRAPFDQLGLVQLEVDGHATPYA